MRFLFLYPCFWGLSGFLAKALFTGGTQPGLLAEYRTLTKDPRSIAPAANRLETILYLGSFDPSSAFASRPF